MSFWTLFEAASMPIMQVMILCLLGAVMAPDYLNLLPADARKSLNKIVFMIFTPSLVFSSLAQTVTLEDIISWWFMPVNIGITFLLGGILGWIAVKILRPKPHLEGLVIAACATGNLGNLPLIIIPAVCKQDGSPFGDSSVCSSTGLSYASFSMALGGFYIWTYTFHLIRSSAKSYKSMIEAEEATMAYDDVSKLPNGDFNTNIESHLLQGETQEQLDIVVPPTNADPEDAENQPISKRQDSRSKAGNENVPIRDKIMGFLHQIMEEVLAPSSVAAVVGLFFGAVSWMRNLLIGDNAPFRVIQDSIQLLGDGTIPCITLILGGNLTQGLRKARVKPLIIIAVICVRYVILPAIGIFVVKAASHLGFLPSDPLYHFVLLIQFTLPPGMAIGTMTQLYDVAQEEC